MKTCVSILILILLTSPTFATTFGDGADMKKLVAISTVLAEPENYLDRVITVKGAIVAVCNSRGCWMKLASDKRFQTLRIKVKDGDMVFPLSAKGKTAFATGKLKAFHLDKKQATAYLSHMAKEANEEFDKSSVKSGITVYQFHPTGVSIAE